ncbi:MAG: diacylglycerol kinase family lipid kinase [Muribaculaceae bacterium]|nr:diacylglycerol kinase family lipid kinase [Muribaculaceae bacterium]
MPDSKSFMMIVNPASGTVSKHRLVPHIIKRLKQMGIECDVRGTTGPGHATELARQAAAEGFHTVLACGGDGTVNEVATGLCGTSTAMGIIPTGSGNGLARHLGIPVDVDSSLKVIAESNIISADYGTANDRPFFCTCGVGFDAAVSERCARQKRRGIVMYLKNVVNEYVNFNPEEYQIEVNGQIITDRAFLVVCCNASQYGNNAFVAPGASVTDGELDLVIVHAGNILSQAIVGVDMMTGFIGKNALVDIIRTPAAIIRRKHDGAAHVDGDAVMMGSDINIRCHPGLLHVYSPTSKTRFRPIVTPLTLMVRDSLLAVRHLFHNNI